MAHATSQLFASIRGDAEATRTLEGEVYETLRRVARSHLRSEYRTVTLSTTDLVHEAYLRLVDQTHSSPEARSHFIGIASRVMRQVLVDYARRKYAAKRGGGVRAMPIELAEALPQAGAQSGEAERANLVLSIDRALDLLQRHDERLVRVVECRFFGGLTEEETAQALDVSVRTVQRDWVRARAYLSVLLSEQNGSAGEGAPGAAA